MAEYLYKAIVTTGGIRYPGGPYNIEKRYMNGVVVGRAGCLYLACFNSKMRDSLARSPIVGSYGALDRQQMAGWVWPLTDPIQMLALSDWYGELRRRTLLDWRRSLARFLVEQAMVKLAIEDYSPEDLIVLRDRAWFVGRSLHAPLWRVYALAPARLWETSSEFPRFDGVVRSVARFGQIYNPYAHKLVWK